MHTATAPQDQRFALLFFIIGAIGIPPAVYLLSALGASILDSASPLIPSNQHTGFAVASTLFAWGMTLFLGYARAMFQQPWRWRRLLWRGTVLYNATLGALFAALIREPNIATAWFALLTILAAIALRRLPPQKA
jgi:hypothetical protein